MATGDVPQQVSHRRVETMALGVRIPGQRARELAYQLRKVGEEPRELAASRAQIRAKDIGLAGARELLERGDERPIRRADRRIAGTVEDENAVSRHVLRQLSNEPALSRARLAGDQTDSPAFGRVIRQERSQGGELPCAPDKGKRGGKAEWARKPQQLGRGHNQI